MAAAAAVTELSSAMCHGGQVKVFEHASEVLKCAMKFAAFIPPQAAAGRVPVVYFLSGLTCNHENFITKAGAQRTAAELGLMLVCPDTSPRGVKIEGDDAAWDFGVGAGFYVDATEEKWKANYNMYSYITRELPAIVEANLPVDAGRKSIFGHSMGGHGALICALKNPGMYKSVSAFAPICHPSECPWGQKAFTGYLGADKQAWAAYDATALAATYSGPPLDILIDQGSVDKFYKEKQLLPEDFLRACAGNCVPVAVRMQQGYDHSYYFITSFIDEHLRHHANYLKQ